MYSSGSSGSMVGTLIIILIVLIIIFFICRELICWYYKINRIVELMEEQNGLLKRMLGDSNPQEVSESITQKDHNAQNESVDVEKLIPDGWADNVSEVEKVVAQKLLKKIQPQHVIAKIISKNEMEVWSLRFWESVKDNSDYKLIYYNSI